jgi:TM2 domain-containing membrane protein YozV
MNCAVHTDIPAAAFCRTCGKALCENCKRDVMGAIYCEPCIAARLQAPPGAPVQQVVVPVATVPNAPSPGLALVLGFIPGVGAMYNGQFMKAFINVVIFVLLIMAANRIDAFGLLVAFWIFYMAFEAYKTAQAKMLGQPAPDFLGIEKIFGIQENQPTTAGFTATTPGNPVVSGTAPGGVTAIASPAVAVQDQVTVASGEPQTPVGAIVLIALGALFLLGNMNILPNINRIWPVFLIALGLWIAYRHMAPRT